VVAPRLSSSEAKSICRRNVQVMNIVIPHFAFPNILFSFKKSLINDYIRVERAFEWNWERIEKVEIQCLIDGHINW
jgi:hypothetical protein